MSDMYEPNPTDRTRNDWALTLRPGQRVAYPYLLDANDPTERVKVAIDGVGNVERRIFTEPTIEMANGLCDAFNWWFQYE